MGIGIASIGIARMGISVLGIAEKGIAGIPYGGVLRPPQDELIQWLTAYPSEATGEPDFNDKVGTYATAQATEMPCLTLDATHGQFVLTTFGSPAANEFTSEIGFSTSDVNAGILIDTGGISSANVGICCQVISGKIRFRIAQGTSGVYAFEQSGGNGFADGEEHHISISFNRTTLRVIIKLDGTEIINGVSLSDIGAESYNYALGAGNYGAVLPFSGSIWGFCLSGVATLPLCETSGPTAYDVSGNGNDGTMEPGTGDLETMWANTQDVYNYIGEYGGAKNPAYTIFDGIDDSVSVTSIILAPNTTYTMDSVLRTLGGTEYWYTFGTSGRLFGGGANYLVGGTQDTGVPILTGRHRTGITFGATTGEIVAFILDGVEVWTGSVPANSTGVLRLASSVSGTQNGDIDFYGFYVDDVLRLAPSSVDAINIIDTLTGDIYSNAGTGDLTQGGGGYDPALLDGTETAAGGPITLVGSKFHAGGIVHNGGPYKIKHTTPVFLDNPFWSANGTTPDAKTYADLFDHVDWTDNVLIKCEPLGANDTPHFVGVATYAQGKDFTPAEYEQGEKWLGDCDTGGRLEAEYDLDGTIQINQDGSVELVQPTT